MEQYVSCLTKQHGQEDGIEPVSRHLVSGFFCLTIYYAQNYTTCVNTTSDVLFTKRLIQRYRNVSLRRNQHAYCSQELFLLSWIFISCHDILGKCEDRDFREIG